MPGSTHGTWLIAGEQVIDWPANRCINERFTRPFSSEAVTKRRSQTAAKLCLWERKELMLGAYCNPNKVFALSASAEFCELLRVREVLLFLHVTSPVGPPCMAWVWVEGPLKGRFILAHEDRWFLQNKLWPETWTWFANQLSGVKTNDKMRRLSKVQRIWR